MIVYMTMFQDRIYESRDLQMISYSFVEYGTFSNKTYYLLVLFVKEVLHIALVANRNS